MKSSKALFRTVLLSLLCVLSLLVSSGCAEGEDTTPKTKYTVSFDSDGGSQVADLSVTEGERASVPPSPTKAGFVFAGWYLGEELWVFGEDEVKSSITLKAKWVDTSVSQIVTFNSDGGSPVLSQIISESGRITEPQAPTKAGYSFGGWYVGDSKWNFATDTATDGTELLAKWVIVDYTVSYTLGKNATNAPENPESYTVADGAIQLKAPTRPGFTFTGWLVGDDTVPKPQVTIGEVLGDVSLTASWAVDQNYGKYSISYDLGGGTNNPANPTVFTVGSGTVTILPPTREHYDFIGWTYDGVSEPTADLSFNAPANLGNKHFTANWRAKSYKITYVSYGATHIGNPLEYTAEDLPLSLNPAVRDGLYFAGWYSDAGLTEYSPVVTECKTLTLYARLIVGTEGLEYSLNADGISYTVTGYSGSESRVYVPATYGEGAVVGIGERAFAAKGISAVTLPGSIKRIGKAAFAGCAALSTVNVPAGTEYIGDGAFRGCTLLSSSYTLYEGVYYLGDKDAPYTVAMKAAPSADGVVTLHPDTKIIGSYAFENTSKISSLVLPEGVVMLCDHALYGLDKLSDISIPDTLKHVGAYAFNDCALLEFTELDGISYLGNDENPYMILISVNGSPSEVTVLAQTKIIYAYAFSNCKKTAVTFEGAKEEVSISDVGNDLLFPATPEA